MNVVLYPKQAKYLSPHMLYAISELQNYQLITTNFVVCWMKISENMFFAKSGHAI